MTNVIHPTAIVSESATLGTGNYIGPFCLIGPNTQIGDNNRFEAYCSIATPPEHKDFWDKDHQSVVIGDNCVFREFITVNSGTINNTLISNNVIMLKGSHVGHDSIVHSLVTLSCNVMVGGHSIIYQGANLGLSAVLHQYSQIGQYAMIGMATVVTKKTTILPFNVYTGNPAKFLKLNQIGIQKSKLTMDEVKKLQIEFNQKFMKTA